MRKGEGQGGNIAIFAYRVGTRPENFPQMAKTNTRIYYSIGEVAEMFDVSPTLIRFWEQKFDILKPHRNKKGNRLFTPEDLENLKLIYHLVKENGMTLAGARKRLKDNRLGIKQDMEVLDRLYAVRSILLEMRQALKVGNDDFAMEYDAVAEEPSTASTRAEILEEEEAAVKEDAAENKKAEFPEISELITGDTRPEVREEEEAESEEPYDWEEDTMELLPESGSGEDNGFPGQNAIPEPDLFDAPASILPDSILDGSEVDPDYMEMLAEEAALAEEVAEAIATLDGEAPATDKPIVVEQTLF